jgi:hypothetical protein
MDSLGSTLFRDNETRDFDLILEDGEFRDTINTHRLTLKHSSPFFARVLGGKFYFYYIWTIPKDSSQAALNLIHYMYTRNIDDLNLKQYGCILLELSLRLEMCSLYNLIDTYLFQSLQSERTVTESSSQDSKYYNTRSKKQMILRKRSRRDM